MPSTSEVIDEQPRSATVTAESATLGGENKRSIEQITLLAFIVLPFVALVGAIPLAWGWG